LLKRTGSRLLYREELWNGNRERWNVVFSWNSVVLWGITMWFRYKTGINQNYDEIRMTDLEFPLWFSKYPTLTVIKICDSSETESFLSSFTKKED
jgi:hypothetical protein